MEERDSCISSQRMEIDFESSLMEETSESSLEDWVIASTNQAVQWITPLGLPVVQPYRQFGRHLVMVKRQRTAFPPNFVHSLDGSHMMMTTVACKKAGLNFAGVHDSYWTHACDVDEMNRILREKFVELYDAPILENLLESFQKTFPALNFPPLPERGDFDLQEIWKLQSACLAFPLAKQPKSSLLARGLKKPPNDPFTLLLGFMPKQPARLGELIPLGLSISSLGHMNAKLQGRCVLCDFHATLKR
ncbi:hypothetical protein JHK85_023047 [Glycine max]|nr:hypothetical protein JHK85_023047 [Glycine max]